MWPSPATLPWVIGPLKRAVLSLQGDLSELLFLFTPARPSRLPPHSKQPMAHLTVSSLSLGHALLAWYLSRQSRA